MMTAKIAGAMLFGCIATIACRSATNTPSFATQKSPTDRDPNAQANYDIRESILNGSSELVILSKNVPEDRELITQLNAAGFHSQIGIYLIEIPIESELPLTGRGAGAAPKIGGAAKAAAAAVIPDDEAADSSDVPRRIRFNKRVTVKEIPKKGQGNPVILPRLGYKSVVATEMAAQAEIRGIEASKPVTISRPAVDRALAAARERAKGLEAMPEATFVEIMARIDTRLVVTEFNEPYLVPSEQRKLWHQFEAVLVRESGAAAGADADAPAALGTTLLLTSDMSAPGDLVTLRVMTPTAGPADVTKWFDITSSWLSPYWKR